MRQLSRKQNLFVLHYIETGNATEAARRAGYETSESALAGIGYENLRKPQIQARIAERLQEESVTAKEVVNTLSAQMRADATDLFDENDQFSVQNLRSKKLGHLLKKIKIRRVFEQGPKDEKIPVDLIEVELHSQQAAAIQLAKLLGLEQAPRQNEYDRSREERIQAEIERIAQEHGVAPDVVAQRLKGSPELKAWLEGDQRAG